MPAMQTPRTHWHRAEAIAGNPACRSGSCPRCRRRELTDTHRRHRRQASSNRPRASCRSGACPRYGRRALADTPPTSSQASQLVGAGLARDADTAHSLAPRRRYRRQASSNGARATCRSGACPRCKRRELADTAPTPSQASQLQHGSRCRSGSCPRCKRRVLADTPPTPSQASQLQQSSRQL